MIGNYRRSGPNVCLRVCVSQQLVFRVSNHSSQASDRPAASTIRATAVSSFLFLSFSSLTELMPSLYSHDDFFSVTHVHYQEENDRQTDANILEPSAI